MTRYLFAYLGAIVTFLLLDFVWLTIVAKDFYHSQIGELMLAEPKLGIAAVFYVVYAAGLVIFSVVPALQAQRWQVAAVLGAALGIVAYATYDLSNLATLRGWSWSLTVVDIAWGAVVSAATATAGYWVASWWQSAAHS